MTADVAPLVSLIQQHLARYGLNSGNVRVEPRRLGAGSIFNRGDLRGGEATQDGVIGMEPVSVYSLGRAAAGMGKRGYVPNGTQVAAIRAALHEIIHLSGGRRDFGALTPDQMRMEEASSESLTRDMLPSVLKRLYNYRYQMPTGGAFDDAVRQFNYASGKKTGGDHRTRAARIWRRQYGQADQATRDMMLR